MRLAERAFVVAVLAWTAGAVDAIGFLVLGGVFTSHVTGNAAGLTIALLTARAHHPYARVIVLLAFAGGALAGAILVERHPDHSAADALCTEGALLVMATAVLWGARQMPSGAHWELAVLAAAMGIQNIALAGSSLSAHTTHITGPLTDLAGTIARRLVGRRQLPRDRSHGAFVYGGRVFAFIAGAACGVELFEYVGGSALLLPAALVVMIAMLLWRHPEHTTGPAANPA